MCCLNYDEATFYTSSHIKSTPTMKSVINPEYSHLADDFKKVIEGDYTPLKVYCDKRNRVELIEVGGRKFVVKRYRHLPPALGLIYTFFRKTKARKAYEHALLLLDKGISTPKPAAYYERKRFGIFSDGWFISEYMDLPTLLESFYHGGFTPEEHHAAAIQLSEFTAKLHSAGIQPLDYNTSNIMYRKEGNEFQFALIDINRMRFGRVPGLKDSMRAFFQIGIIPSDYIDLLTPYILQRGFNFEASLYQILRHQRRMNRKRSFKAMLHRLFRRNK